jgi:hypothetical protein
MSLTEVVVSLAIGGLVFGTILSGYVQSARRAEWSAYNLAGHSLAMQRLEQARAAKWDTQASPPVDQLVASNFPPKVDILDIPVSGTNITYATTLTTISNVSADPPLKLIYVTAIWQFPNSDAFSNVISTYRSPDQ